MLDGEAGRGDPLPDTARERLEARHGTDLGNVRVHDDSEAHRMATGVGARAFTYGSDIYFRDGAYDPAGVDGRRTLDHEVAHTLQQATSPRVQREWFDDFVSDAAPLTSIAVHGQTFSEDVDANLIALEEIVAAEGSAALPRAVAELHAHLDLLRREAGVAEVVPSETIEELTAGVETIARSAGEYFGFEVPDITTDEVRTVLRGGRARTRREAARSIAAGALDADFFHAAATAVSAPFDREAISSDVAAAERIVASVDAAYELVLAELAFFRESVRREAHDTLNEMLNAEHALGEAIEEQYGITVGSRTVERWVSSSGHGGTRRMVEETTYGTARDDQRASLAEEAGVLLTRLAAVEEAEQTVFVIGLGIAGNEMGPTETEAAELLAAQADAVAASQSYNEARVDAGIRHPILLTMELPRRSPSELRIALGALASSNESLAASAVHSEVARVFANIDDTRRAVEAGGLVPIELEPVRARTLDRLGHGPGTWQAQVAEEVGTEGGRMSDPEALALGLTVVLLLLSGVGWIVGAGALLTGAAAATATGASVAGAIVTGTNVRRYLDELHASGTAFDARNAVLAEEPSLGWLVLDIGLTIVDLEGLRRTMQPLFEAYRGLVRSFSADRVAVEEALATLRQEEALAEAELRRRGRPRDPDDGRAVVARMEAQAEREAAASPALSEVPDTPPTADTPAAAVDSPTVSEPSGIDEATPTTHGDSGPPSESGALPDAPSPATDVVVPPDAVYAALDIEEGAALIESLLNDALTEMPVGLRVQVRSSMYLRAVLDHFDYDAAQLIDYYNRWLGGRSESSFEAWLAHSSHPGLGRARLLGRATTVLTSDVDEALSLLDDAEGSFRPLMDAVEAAGFDDREGLRAVLEHATLAGMPLSQLQSTLKRHYRERLVAWFGLEADLGRRHALLVELFDGTGRFAGVRLNNADRGAIGELWYHQLEGLSEEEVRAARGWEVTVPGAEGYRVPDLVVDSTGVVHEIKSGTSLNAHDRAQFDIYMQRFRRVGDAPPVLDGVTVNEFRFTMEHPGMARAEWSWMKRKLATNEAVDLVFEIPGPGGLVCVSNSAVSAMGPNYDGWLAAGAPGSYVAPRP